MINTERISDWLNEPHQLQEVAPKALLQFAKEYPYFAPAAYLLFVGGKQEPGTMHGLQQSHPVNPVMLSGLIRAASEIPGQAAAPPVIVPEVAVTEINATETIPEKKEIKETTVSNEMDTEENLLIMPASADDYFLQQGIHVPSDLPVVEEMLHTVEQTEKERALMVVMSFAEWLKHISSHNKKTKEEEADKKALKTMWQQQKLAAAIEEESDEIPEQVFEMAVNSISRKDELVSESLAEVYARQGKKEKAIEMYQKLSLLNPEKNTYFAAKIENLQKDL